MIGPMALGLGWRHRFGRYTYKVKVRRGRPDYPPPVVFS